MEIKLNASFKMHQGTLEIVPNRPSSVIGIPFDRPVAGYGGKTINTLRLWSAASHDYFDFQEFSSGDFIGALVGSLAAHTLTRVLYPDDSTEVGQALRLCRSIFWSPVRSRIWCGAFDAATRIGAVFPTRSLSSSTTFTRPWRFRS